MPVSIDWSFGPAPDADEPPPLRAPRRSAHSPRQALRLSRRTWLLLGAVAALALLLTGALPTLEQLRTRRSVEMVVAAQDQARLAGDWQALTSTYLNVPLSWRTVRLRSGWLPTPISLPGLRPDGQPGRVGNFQLLGEQSARADVERGFILANGTRVTFAMPQFYRFAQGAWRQAAPPDPRMDQLQHSHTGRVDIAYYPDDTDLAISLSGELDDLLARACADWACPPELHVGVNFEGGDLSASVSPAPYDSLLGSLSLQIILGRPSAYPSYAVNLTSRLVGGYPADAAAAEAVRRAAGVQALLLVAQQLSPNLLLRGENTYQDALIVREAARLGLDDPRLAQIQIANPLFQPDELWSVPIPRFGSGGALPDALAIVNRLLLDRGVADEQRLMHAFNTAPDPAAWLAAGLGLATYDARARLAGGFDTPFPAVQPARRGLSSTPDLALSCPDGPLLATLAGQTAPLLAGHFPDSVVEAWSPDGHSLALRVSRRLGLVDLAGGAGQFLPLVSWQDGNPAAWASNSVLVYPANLEDPATLVTPATQPETGNTGLVFFNNSDSQQTRIFPNFESYLPAPDGNWAAVTGRPDGSRGALVIIPALSGSPVFNAVNGYNAAWSADSRRLAFALRHGSLSGLAVYDLAAHNTHRVLEEGNLGVPESSGPTGWTAVWSPTGDRLAVASTTDASHGLMGWVGLVSPSSASDGGGFQLLPAVRAGLAPNALAYSADGRFLAVGLFDTSGLRGVALYSVQGMLLRWLPSFQLAAWAPAGHSLALTSIAGVSLLADPGDTSAMPRRIGPDGCSGVAWKP